MSKRTRDKRLVLEGNRWYIKMRIPVDVQQEFGAKTINRSTRTDSLIEAQRQLRALEVEFDVIRLKQKLDSPRELFKSKLEHMINVIDSGDYLNLEDSPFFDVDETITEPERDAIQEAKHYYIEGKLPDSSLTKSKYGITLSEALELELKLLERKPKAEQISKKRKTAISIFTKFIGKNVRLDTINSTVAYKFVDAMYDEGKSHKTTRNYLAALKACWNAAARYGHVDKQANPFDSIETPVTASESYKPLTRNHIDKLMDATADTTHPLHYLFRIGLFAAPRLVEIIQLRVQDLREVDGVLCIHIEDSKTKNGIRKIPVVGRLANKLQELMKGKSDYLFPELLGRSATYASGLFRQLKLSLGITEKAYSFHSLRSNLATALEQSGVPEHQINRVLGHKITNMSTGTYSEGLKITETLKQLEAAMNHEFYDGL